MRLIGRRDERPSRMEVLQKRTVAAPNFLEWRCKTDGEDEPEWQNCQLVLRSRGLPEQGHPIGLSGMSMRASNW